MTKDKKTEQKSQHIKGHAEDQSEDHEKNRALGQFDVAGDDAVVPFEVDGLDIRGRSVQLGDAVNSILNRHNYPEAVSRLLGEAMVLTVLIGTSLKFDGKFIFQTVSNGPVNLLVCDFQTPSNLRAYARFDEEALEKAIKQGKTKPAELLGQGRLALTVDQGEHMQPYQGIVALDGKSLEEIACGYFGQSEQIKTNIRLAVATLMNRDKKSKPQKSWRAGGLLAQLLPPSSKIEKQAEILDQKQLEDHWQEALALTNTIDSDEMTDPQVGTERLLYRLFHEHGVRVFAATKVFDRCSCSREKIENVLLGFSSEELEQSVENGKITVGCEFCSTNYEFDPKQLAEEKTKQNNC